MYKWDEIDEIEYYFFRVIIKETLWVGAYVNAEWFVRLAMAEAMSTTHSSSTVSDFSS